MRQEFLARLIDFDLRTMYVGDLNGARLAVRNRTQVILVNVLTYILCTVDLIQFEVFGFWLGAKTRSSKLYELFVSSLFPRFKLQNELSTFSRKKRFIFDNQSSFKTTTR